MPALKQKYATKEEIPEAYQGMYSEKGGEWVLSDDLEIEGMVDRNTHREFVNNNKALHEKSEAKDTEIEALKKKAADLEAAAGNTDKEKETLAERIDRLEKSKAETDAELAKEREATVTERKKAIISKVAAGAGGRPKALSRIANDLVGEFDFVDGELVQVKGGKPVLSDDNAGKYVTVDERLVSFAKEEDYLFGETSGDQAPGSGETDFSTLDIEDKAAVQEATLELTEKMEKDGVTHT